MPEEVEVEVEVALHLQIAKTPQVFAGALRPPPELTPPTRRVVLGCVDGRALTAGELKRGVAAGQRGRQLAEEHARLPGFVRCVPWRPSSACARQSAAGASLKTKHVRPLGAQRKIKGPTAGACLKCTFLSASTTYLCNVGGAYSIF